MDGVEGTTKFAQGAKRGAMPELLRAFANFAYFVV